VHRRILFGMWEQGNTAGKAYKKSARIVGGRDGQVPPPRRRAIYDTLVRMAQLFSMPPRAGGRQGNFGSVDGDNAAAMRYTEVRLARLAEEMLGDDLEKETVNWQPNYDGSLKEPVVLPSKFPNLLVNGSSGSRSGWRPISRRTTWASGRRHDCDRRNPAISVDELIRLVPGPDFPTAAIIRGTAGSARRTRPGTARCRCRRGPASST